MSKIVKKKIAKKILAEKLKDPKKMIRKLIIKNAIPVISGIILIVLIISVIMWLYDHTIGAVIEAVRGAITAIKGIFCSTITQSTVSIESNQALQDAINKKLSEIGDVSMFGLSKEGVKYYLSKFIKAELVTTYPDMSDYTMRQGLSTQMQGNVRFKRTVPEDGGMRELIYMKNEDFMSLVGTPSKESIEALRYRFTTNPNNPQEVIIAYFIVKRKEVSNGNGEIVEYIINTETIDLFAALSEYSMPFELPLILMLTTKSAQYAEAVADLALDSKITIGVYDTQSVNVTTIIEDVDVYTEDTSIYKGYEDISEMKTDGSTSLIERKDFSYQDGPHTNKSSNTVKTVETNEISGITVKPLEVGGWIAEYEADYEVQKCPSKSVPQQKEVPTAAEKKASEWVEKKYASYDQASLNENGIIKELRQKKALEFIEKNKGTNKVYNLSINYAAYTIRTKTETARTRSSTTTTSKVVQKYAKKLSREDYFLGLIRNATGNIEKLYCLTEDKLNEDAKYDPNGKSVKYVDIEYDDKIYYFSEDQKQKNEKNKDKYVKINLPEMKELICYYIAEYNSTANLEGVMRYLISKLSGEADKKAISVNDFINGFGKMEFNNVNYGGNASDQFLAFLHAWEGHTGITPDGKYYIVGDDGAGHPTVGYGVDIFNGGFADRFRAAGYGTSMGSKVPVEFVDALEKEEINQGLKTVESKTSGLNLTEYQKFALLSRVYNCGESGAFMSRNGKTFVQAYKAYWNPEKDNELGGKENSATYSNSLYSQYMNVPITSGGNILQGLINRRKAEWLLFKYGYFNRTNTYYTEASANGAEGGIIVQNAVKLHKWLRENGYSYRQVGLNIPIDGNGQGRYIDCSSYVSWVLYESGFTNFKGYQNTSAVFKTNPWGWQEISSIAQAKAGDILCYNGHVEIYAGSVKNGKARVYNCGGAASIAAAEESGSGFSTTSIVKILRPPAK